MGDIVHGVRTHSVSLLQMGILGRFVASMAVLAEHLGSQGLAFDHAMRWAKSLLLSVLFKNIHASHENISKKSEQHKANPNKACSVEYVNLRVEIS